MIDPGSVGGEVVFSVANVHEYVFDVVFLRALVKGLAEEQVLHQERVLYICGRPLGHCRVHPQVVLVLLVVSPLDGQFDVLATLVAFV